MDLLHRWFVFPLWSGIGTDNEQNSDVMSCHNRWAATSGSAMTIDFTSAGA